MVRFLFRQRGILILVLVLLSVVTMLIELYLVGKSEHAPQQTFPKTRLLPITNTTRCTRPVENIMFLKTHKTGSSTLTNLLNRYADKKDLNVVLPAQGEVYSFYWPYQFQLNFVAPLSSLPNILCNHARFNKIPLNILLPKPRAKYITLLREPISNYESVFYFFRLNYFLKLKNERFTTMNRYLSRNISLTELQEMMTKTPSITVRYLARNPHAFDLGLGLEHYENFTAVKNYIEFLDSEFDLVLILEHFDESLVLMKRLFCWDLKDILYIKQLQRLKVDKNKEAITDNLKYKIRSWNKADGMLYSHFNATLWKRIYSEGPDFDEDLRTFRQELKHLHGVCLEKGTRKTLTSGRKYVKGYKLKPNVTEKMKNYCQNFVLSEIDYLDYYREKIRNKAH